MNETRKAQEESVEMTKIQGIEAAIKKCTWAAWILVYAGAPCLAFGIWVWVNKDGGKLALDKLDPLGSWIQGTVGCLWALASFLFIYVAFLGQRLQMMQQERQISEQKVQYETERKEQECRAKEQKEQYELERRERDLQFKEQQLQFKEQRESIARQNFEHTFFQMLDLQNQIAGELEASATGTTQTPQGIQTYTVNRSSRGCFEIWYMEFVRSFNTKEFWDKSLNKPAQSKEDIAYVRSTYRDFYEQHQAELGHYFRNLYHTFKWVHTSEIPKENKNLSELENKRRYTSIARAQLSQYELALLFYNALTAIPPEKVNKFKEIVEIYGLMENLNPELLVLKSHLNFYDKSAYADSKGNSSIAVPVATPAT